jgi:cysteinyl-tRNA synthetase
LRIYNTLTHSVEKFQPIHDRKVGIYSCGPTVYGPAHIGNMRTYIGLDLLKRALLYNGYSIKNVMNITDVGHLIGDGNVGEDKVSQTARKEHKTERDVADYYKKMFLEDIEKLNILMPDVLVNATENIPEMLEMIDKLYEKGFLYKVHTGMYFDTSKIKNYGILTGMNFKKLNESLIAGVRVERIEGIKNKTDFAVWRFFDSQESSMQWDSNYGRGFPGWHIECSAMSKKYLGEHFDIHTGGVDHIPVHHTNEIAQSEASCGKNPARYWFHYEFLLVDGKKMSKSLGNIYTLEDIEKKGYSPMTFRYFITSGYYRQQLNFTFEALDNASNTLNGIYAFLRKIGEMIDMEGDENQEFGIMAEEYKKAFFDELDNDMNTPNALANMHRLISITNKKMEEGSLSGKDAGKICEIMIEFDKILGIGFDKHIHFHENKLPEEVNNFLKIRENARASKDFKKADEIRKLLMERYNIIVEDTKSGQKWHYK